MLLMYIVIGIVVIASIPKLTEIYAFHLSKKTSEDLSEKLNALERQ